MEKQHFSNRRILITGIFILAIFILMPSLSSAATVAYSTDFSKTVNLIVLENNAAIELAALNLQGRNLPYGRGAELEIPAVHKSIDPRSPDAKISFPAGLWLLGSALLAMVGYKRMRNTHDWQRHK